MNPIFLFRAFRAFRGSNAFTTNYTKHTNFLTHFSPIYFPATL